MGQALDRLRQRLRERDAARQAADRLPDINALIGGLGQAGVDVIGAAAQGASRVEQAPAAVAARMPSIPKPPVPEPGPASPPEELASLAGGPLGPPMRPKGMPQSLNPSPTIANDPALQQQQFQYLLQSKNRDDLQTMLRMAQARGWGPTPEQATQLQTLASTLPPDLPDNVAKHYKRLSQKSDPSQDIYASVLDPLYKDVQGNREDANRQAIMALANLGPEPGSRMRPFPMPPEQTPAMQVPHHVKPLPRLGNKYAPSELQRLAMAEWLALREAGNPPDMPTPYLDKLAEVQAEHQRWAEQQREHLDAALAPLQTPTQAAAGRFRQQVPFLEPLYLASRGANAQDREDYRRLVEGAAARHPGAAGTGSAAGIGANLALMGGAVGGAGQAAKPLGRAAEAVARATAFGGYGTGHQISADPTLLDRPGDLAKAAGKELVAGAVFEGLGAGFRRAPTALSATAGQRLVRSVAEGGALGSGVAVATGLYDAATGGQMTFDQWLSHLPEEVAFMVGLHTAMGGATKRAALQRIYEAAERGRINEGQVADAVGRIVTGEPALPEPTPHLPPTPSRKRRMRAGVRAESTPRREADLRSYEIRDPALDVRPPVRPGTDAAKVAEAAARARAAGMQQAEAPTAVPPDIRKLRPHDPNKVPLAEPPYPPRPVPPATGEIGLRPEQPVREPGIPLAHGAVPYRMQGEPPARPAPDQQRPTVPRPPSAEAPRQAPPTAERPAARQPASPKSAEPRVGGTGMTEPWQMTQQEFGAIRVGPKLNERSAEFTTLPTTEQARLRSEQSLRDQKNTALDRLQREIIATADNTMQPDVLASKLASASTSEAAHRALVEQALREGKPVPPEVLKDYPDLAKAAKPTPPRGQQRARAVQREIAEQKKAVAAAEQTKLAEETQWNVQTLADVKRVAEAVKQGEAVPEDAVKASRKFLLDARNAPALPKAERARLRKSLTPAKPDADQRSKQEVTLEPAEAGEAREPWQLTQRQVVNRLRTAGQGEPALAADFHRKAVEQALREGKPVPPEVLKDHPDLKPLAGTHPQEEVALEPAGGPKRVTQERGSTLPFTFTSPRTGKPVHLADVMQRARERMGLPVYKGGIKGKALGTYNARERRVRTRKSFDLETELHEFGHDIYMRRITENIPDNVKAELEKLDYKPDRGNANEGFAVFFRMWATDRLGQAALYAPETTKWFEAEWGKGHLEDARIVESIRADVEAYLQQDPLDSLYSHIEPTPSMRQKVASSPRRAWNWLKTKFFTRVTDRNWILKEFDKDVEQQAGRPLKPSESGHKQIEAASKRNWHRAYAIAEQGIYGFRPDPNRPGEKIQVKLAPSLSEVARPVRNDLRSAFGFAVARRALERWSRGKDPGIPRTVAKAAYKRLRTPEREQFADKIEQMFDAALDELVDAGQFTSPEIQTIKESSTYYFPLQRVIDETVFGAGGGRRFGNVPRPVRRMKGSGKTIKDPLMMVVEELSRILNTADRVRLGRLLAENSKRYGGLGGWVSERVKPVTGRQTTLDEVRRGLKVVDTSGDVRTEYTKKLREILEKAETDMTDKGLSDIINLFVADARMPGQKHVVSFWKDGKQHHYDLGKDLYEAVMDTDPYHLPWVLDATLGAATRLVKLGATGLNPEFTLGANPLFDSITLSLNAHYAKGGYSAIQQWAKGLKRGLKGRFANDPVFDLYVQGGNEFSQWLVQDRALTRRQIESILKGRKPEANLIRHPIDAMRHIMGLTESAGRMAEFEAALRALGWREGLPVTENQLIEASYAAGEVTLPFHRAGTWTRAINQIIPYFNPAVQDLAKMWREGVRGPQKKRFFLRTARTLIGPALALWWANKDKKWYRDLPAWEKVGFLHYKPEGMDAPMRLPLPPGYGALFAGYPVAMMDYLYQKEPEALKQKLSAGMGKLLPDARPSLVTPFVEAWGNYDTFRGRPIVSRGKERLLPAYQYSAGTKPFYRELGKVMGISPAKLQHVTEGITGGMASRVLSADPRTWREVADIPMVRRFVSRPYTGSRIQEKFYRLLGEYGPYRSTWNFKDKDKAFYAAYKDRVDGALILQRANRKAGKVRDAYRKQYGEKLSPSQRKQRNAELDAIMREALGRVKRGESPNGRKAKPTHKRVPLPDLGRATNRSGIAGRSRF